MTTSVELDGVSAAWNLDSLQPADDKGDRLSGDVVAQSTPAEPAAKPAEPAPAASGEPVPVDVGSGTPVQPGAAAPNPATDAPLEYTADASNVVKLPANVSIENIRVEGSDLVLEQADGTLVTIKDAAANVPTFMIGDVEVPRVALLAALEASGVDVAFGADGSMAASPASNLPNSSGGNFEVPPGGIGDGFDLSDLLPPTALAFRLYDGEELFASVNADPLFENFSVTISEEGLDNANPDDVGSDDTTNAKIITGNFGATDRERRPADLQPWRAGPGHQCRHQIRRRRRGLGSGQPDAAGRQGRWRSRHPNHDHRRQHGRLPDRTHRTLRSRPRRALKTNLAIVIPVTVEDPFGGSKTANMTVVVEDDSPVLDPCQNSSLRDWTLDDDQLADGNDSADNPVDHESTTRRSRTSRWALPGRRRRQVADHRRDRRHRPGRQFRRTAAELRRRSNSITRPSPIATAARR